MDSNDNHIIIHGSVYFGTFWTHLDFKDKALNRSQDPSKILVKLNHLGDTLPVPVSGTSARELNNLFLAQDYACNLITGRINAKQMIEQETNEDVSLATGHQVLKTTYFARLA